MKLTKSQLKQLIKEELGMVMEGEYEGVPYDDRYEAEEREARRGPSGKMTPEEHTEYLALYDDDETEAPTYYALVEDVEYHHHILSDKDMKELLEEAEIYGSVKAIFTANVIEGEL